MYEFTDGKHVVVEKVTIERKPSDVFAFITTPENVPLFWSNISEYELLSEEHEKGARAKATFRIAGRKMHWTAELVEYELDELLSWRSIEAPFPFQYEYRFEP
ncbi:MAG: SRPBCC family protein, partial [Nitriliruptorales bacterium]|nr:SRPBCC family protein [Nitriliruptorales bacterium]